jgi:hypothetical protein
MAKLTRYNQKIFGATGPTGVLGQFGSFAAGSPTYTNDPDDIQALTAYGQGLGAALINNAPPAIQDINALSYLITRQLAYCFQNGIPEWNAETEYHTGSLVTDAAGNIYKSVANTNVNHALSVTNYWMILLSRNNRQINDANYTVLYDDYIMRFTTAQTTNVYLPNVNSATVGRILIVKKLFSSATSITVNAYSGTTIDGVSTHVITTNAQASRYISNGSGWFII